MQNMKKSCVWTYAIFEIDDQEAVQVNQQSECNKVTMLLNKRRKNLEAPQREVSESVHRTQGESFRCQSLFATGDCQTAVSQMQHCVCSSLL